MNATTRLALERLIVLALSVLLLSSCRSAVPSDSVPSLPMVSPTVEPILPSDLTRLSEVPSPTPILEARATEPDPPQADASGLSSSGPWLVYASIDYSQFYNSRMESARADHSLYVVNLDGSAEPPLRSGTTSQSKRTRSLTIRTIWPFWISSSTWFGPNRGLRISSPRIQMNAGIPSSRGIAWQASWPAFVAAAPRTSLS